MYAPCIQTEAILEGKCRRCGTPAPSNACVLRQHTQITDLGMRVHWLASNASAYATRWTVLYIKPVFENTQMLCLQRVVGGTPCAGVRTGEAMRVKMVVKYGHDAVQVGGGGAE